jgi:hypothetical protein
MKEIGVSVALGGLGATVVAAGVASQAGYPVVSAALGLIACVTAVAMVGQHRADLEQGFQGIRQVCWSMLELLFEHPARDLDRKQGAMRYVTAAVVYLAPALALAVLTFLGIYWGFSRLAEGGGTDVMPKLAAFLMLYALAMRTIGVSTRALLGKRLLRSQRDRTWSTPRPPSAPDDGAAPGSCAGAQGA